MDNFYVIIIRQKKIKMRSFALITFHTFYVLISTHNYYTICFVSFCYYVETYLKTMMAVEDLALLFSFLIMPCHRHYEAIK